MSCDQCLDYIQRESEGQLIRASRYSFIGSITLEQPTVNQQAAGVTHVQLPARAGHALFGAMLLDDRIAHG